MNRSRIIVVLIVALMVTATFPPQVAHGQGAFTEKLNVFVSGSNALW